jgi:uncharacterized protein YeaO (DUF488 family)
VKLRTKRIHEPAAPEDGTRILVDRLWPRGVSKERAQLDAWVRDVAPSDELRRWFAHDPAKWPEFTRRYFAELDANAEAVDEVRRLAGEGPATLLFAAKDEEHNNAVALRAYLESR